MTSETCCAIFRRNRRNPARKATRLEGGILCTVSSTFSMLSVGSGSLTCSLRSVPGPSSLSPRSARHVWRFMLSASSSCVRRGVSLLTVVEQRGEEEAVGSAGSERRSSCHGALGGRVGGAILSSCTSRAILERLGSSRLRLRSLRSPPLFVLRSGLPPMRLIPSSSSSREEVDGGLAGVMLRICAHCSDPLSPTRREQHFNLHGLFHEREGLVCREVKDVASMRILTESCGCA